MSSRNSTKASCETGTRLALIFFPGTGLLLHRLLQLNYTAQKLTTRTKLKKRQNPQANILPACVSLVNNKRETTAARVT